MCWPAMAIRPMSYMTSHFRCEPDRGGGGGGDAGMAGEELFSVQCTERVEMMAGDRCTPYTWRRVRWGMGSRVYTTTSEGAAHIEFRT